MERWTAAWSIGFARARLPFLAARTERPDDFLRLTGEAFQLFIDRAFAVRLCVTIGERLDDRHHDCARSSALTSIRAVVEALKAVRIFSLRRAISASLASR